MIFGFGKRRPDKSFKQRVTEFWQWYPQVAERFFQTIERGQCKSLAKEVGDFMDRTLPGLAWVFGPGEQGGHSFTVSGEGVVAKQLLAEYWHSRATELPHWTFHASRQPCSHEDLKAISIRLGEHESVDAEHFLIQPNVDADAQLIDIIAWHPAFESLTEDDQHQILFLLLDEALGEFGTETWLGDIKVEPFTAGQGTVTLAALPDKIQQVDNYYRWKKLPPLRAYSVYELKEQTDTARGDTLVGSTCISRVVSEFLHNQGKLKEDPLRGTGAEFAYLAIDSSVFPNGKQTDVRGKIEDAVGDALAKSESGRTLGGAFGLRQSYIDLLFFDGLNSRQVVETTLEGLQLRGKSQVLSFV